MKAILEFALPDDRESFEAACKADDWRCVVDELNNQLRSWTKYGHEFKDIDAALHGVRDRLWQELNERGLDLS